MRVGTYRFIVKGNWKSLKNLCIGTKPMTQGGPKCLWSKLRVY